MFKWLNKRIAFWRSGIVKPLKVIAVAILLLILPAIGIIRDVVLAPENRNWYLLKYIPNWPWYWWVVGILIGLLIFLEETNYRANKASLREQKLKHIERMARSRERHQAELTNARITALISTKDTSKETHVTVTPGERQLFAAMAGQPPPPDKKSLTQSKAEPVLVCKKTYAIPVYWTGYKFIEEQEPKDDGPYAVIAEFVNRPNTKGHVPSIYFLNAQITFYDAKGEYYDRVAHSFWLGYENCYLDLDAGGRGRLVVAVAHRGVNAFGVSNSNAGATRYEEKEPFELVGTSFRVSIYLSAQHGLGEATNFDFTYNADGLPDIKIADAEEV
jgi:hypothetical protein